MPLHANRYNNIIEHVHNNFCDNLLEIGVCKGHTSIEILRWSKNPSISFYGIDLFEDIDEETFNKEVSIPADSRAAVETYLKNASLNVNLFKGFSNKVVDEIENLDVEFDVIFIDGGHSYETVKEDFYNYVKFLKPSGIIFFDDYTPEPGFGIKQLVDELIDAAEYNITIDERYTDTYRDYLFQIAKVTKKAQEDG